MIAYYEGETEHPLANLLTRLAQALGVTTEELAARSKKPVNSRLQQIEKLEPAEKRQILQVIDTLESAQIKRKVQNKQAA